MFKIPDWDDDNQGNKVENILKISKVKKKLKNSNPSPSTKQNGVIKPSFKTKNTSKKNKLNSKKNILLISNEKLKINTQKSSKVVNDSQLADNVIPITVQTNHVQEQTSLNKKPKLNKKNRKKNALLNNNVNGKKSSKVENNKKVSEKPVPMEVQTNQVQEQTSLNKKQKTDEKKFKNKFNNNHVKSKVNIQKSSKVENDNQVAEKPVQMEVQADHEEETSLNKKQKLNKNPTKNKNNSNDNVSLKNYDTDKLDELILIEKKKKLNKVKNDNIEENILFNEKTVENKAKSKIQKKKEFLKSLLQRETNRNHINVKSNALRDRMLERLKAAKFRYLNEKLYTTSGSEAQKLFKEDPSAFQTYHEGYQQQMKKWPVKPLDVIIRRIQKMPKTYKIADMGCGEAELSRRVSQTVRSFDLIARAENIEECDIAHTPILAATIDVAVYCLALMGTNLTQYLLEANRILRIGGHLLIAEVESRFNNVDDFVKDVQKLGFSLKKLDKSHEVFFFMEFTKIRDPPTKKAKIPYLTLKPCIYKKR